jgi:hypothetical protein
MDEIIFKTAAPGDYQRINDFFNKYYKTGRTLDQFKWEFVDCPGGPAIYTMATDKENRIIGIQAGIPITMITSKGQTYLTVKGEDSLLDFRECIKHRGRDIFKELYLFFIDQCKRRDAKILWGFSTMYQSFKKVGFETPFRAGQWIVTFRPVRSYFSLARLNPKNMFMDHVKIGLLAMVSFLSGFRRFLIRNSSLTCKEGVVSSVELFNQMILKDDNIGFIDETKEFLSWRTELNPFPVSYKILNYYTKENLVAQVIISENKSGMSYIEQMIMNKDLSTGQKLKIIRRTITYIKKRGASLIRFMSFNHNNYHLADNKLLEKAGFFFVNKGMDFFFMDISGQTTLFKPQDIYLSRIYTQGVS